MRYISVIVCSYNDGRFLGRALESLCNQSLNTDEFEVFLVNDGSSDDTERIALSFQDKLPLNYIKNDINQGLSFSCNLALKRVKTDCCIRLDADDFFDTTILEKMSKPMRRSETDFVYSDRLELVDSTGATRYVSLEDFSVFKLIGIGTMLRTEKILEIGGYRSLFWEEFDLYMRYLTASEKRPFYIPEPLYTYVRRPGSMTTNTERVKQGWRELRELWSDDALTAFGPVPVTITGGDFDE